MRCGRIWCVAGQGSVGMRRLPLCERQSGAGGGWPPWVSFLTSLPGRLRNPQPALDFLKSPKILERVSLGAGDQASREERT